MKPISGQQLKVRLAGFIALISILLSVGAYYYYQTATEQKRIEKYNELQAVGRLKSNQITQWIKERLSEAVFFSNNEPSRQYIDRILKGDAAAGSSYRRVLADIMADNRYENIVVLSMQGDLLFSYQPDFHLDPLTVNNANEVIELGRTAIKDFFYCDLHHEVHFEIIVPFYDADENNLAAVIFLVNPEDYLYPLITEWPTQNQTAKSYAVKRKNDRVLFLSRLRYQDNSKINFSMGLDQTDVTAVRAVLGHTGILSGLDYRGEKVIADVRKIPNTSWYMISEIDERELYAEMNQQASWVFSTLILVILLITAVVVWYYQVRQRNFYRELLEKRSALYRAQNEFVAALYSIGDGVITTDPHGFVRYINPAAEELTGWKEEEARGKKTEEVFKILNEETRKEMESPVKKVIREKRTVGLINHTLLVAKDGSEVPILDSGSPIKDANGQLLGVVLVFSDQTAERMRRKIIEVRLRIFEYAYDHTLKETATKMLDEIGQLLHSPAGFVGITEPDQGIFSFHAWSTLTQEALSGLEGFGHDLHLEDAGVWDAFIYRKEVVIQNDCHGDSSEKVIPVWYPGLTREMVVPVVRNDRVVAIVGVGNKPRDYTETDAEALSLIVDATWEVAEHKTSEMRVRESEEKMRSIFRVAPTGIGVIRERVILEVNPHFCKMTGYEAAELVGRNARMLYPTQEEFELVGKEKYAQIAKHGRGEVESRWRKKDGTIIDVLVTATPIDISDHEKGMTFTALDITGRNQAKIKLEEQERRLSSIVGNLPGFVYRCEYDKNWTMLYLSENCKKITGYAPKDFIRNGRMTYNDIIKKEYQPGIYRKWEEVVAKKSFFEEEYEIVTADQQVRWVLERGVGIYDDVGRVIFLEGYIEDITTRKSTEIQLVESENKFRNLFHGHAAIKYIIDPDDDRIVEANEAATEFYGWSMEELKRMKITQINVLPPEEVHNIIQQSTRMKNARYEFQHRKANGEIVDIENFNSTVNIGGKIYLHAIIHDITEKKKAERALQESEERNRLIMDNSMDAILLTKPDGQILSANKAAVNMFGRSEQEICRLGRDGLVDPHDARLLKLKEKRDKSGFVKGELNFMRGDGTKFPAEITSSLFKNGKGELFTSIIIRDITERNSWENELIRAKERAEVNDRLKSAFLANMSHEIRTPMNTILGFLGLLDGSDMGKETRQEYIRLVNQSGQRLLSTINDIIEISKIETGAQEVVCSPVNVAEILQFYYEFFKPQAEEKGIDLILERQITGEKARVKTDKNKFNSILTNLINNAIKFTSRGSIRLGNYRDHDFLVFYVRDTGCGIPPDKTEAVFDRFIQADMSLTRVHEGSGLGLSITKAYVELLDGKIWVESEVGKGSTFYFSIPFLEVQEERDSDRDIHRNESDTLAGKTILIAEDDETSYQFLEASLKSKNVHLLHTLNGEETMKAFRNNPDISLILMDIKMPGMDGFEVTREIRKVNETIPVIAQTAYALHGDKERALEAGCNDYISKPIRIEELYVLIRKYL